MIRLPCCTCVGSCRPQMRWPSQWSAPGGPLSMARKQPDIWLAGSLAMVSPSSVD